MTALGMALLLVGLFGLIKVQSGYGLLCCVMLILAGAVTLVHIAP